MLSDIPAQPTHFNVPIYGSSGIVAWALVDARDHRRVSRLHWNLCSGYARACVFGELGRKVLMHRMLCGSHRKQVDHMNGDRLDNRRSNLRPATPGQNCHNRRTNKNSRGGVKGVTQHCRTGRYLAQISHRRRHYHLGSFDTAELAHAAYCAAAKRLHGAFANYGGRI